MYIIIIIILKGENVSLESSQRAPAPETFKPEPLPDRPALRAKSYATSAQLQYVQCNVMLLGVLKDIYLSTVIETQRLKV